MGKKKIASLGKQVISGLRNKEQGFLFLGIQNKHPRDSDNRGLVFEWAFELYSSVSKSENSLSFSWTVFLFFAWGNFCIQHLFCYIYRVIQHGDWTELGRAHSLPVLYNIRTEAQSGHETWSGSHTAHKWQEEDLSPAGVGPGPMLAGLYVVVKARNLTLTSQRLFPVKAKRSLTWKS